MLSIDALLNTIYVDLVIWRSQVQNPATAGNIFLLACAQSGNYELLTREHFYILFWLFVVWLHGACRSEISRNISFQVPVCHAMFGSEKLGNELNALQIMLKLSCFDNFWLVYWDANFSACETIGYNHLSQVYYTGIHSIGISSIFVIIRSNKVLVVMVTLVGHFMCCCNW
jgi:hypothetical protein